MKDKHYILTKDKIKRGQIGFPKFCRSSFYSRGRLSIKIITMQKEIFKKGVKFKYKVSKRKATFISKNYRRRRETTLTFSSWKRSWIGHIHRRTAIQSTIRCLTSDT